MEMPAAPHRSKLMELPHDILNIFSRLPATSLLQFQCVSKSLRDIVNDPAVAAMHLAATNQNVDVEVRALSDSYWYHLEFVSCGLLGFRYYSIYGKGKPLCLLYHPLRGEYPSLPPCEIVEKNCKFVRYGLGFDATTSTHKLVHFVSEHYGGDYSMVAVAHVHVLGTSSWRKIPSITTCGYFVTRKNTYAYGKMYWLAERNQILSFDFEKDKFEWITPPHPHLNFPRESQLFLINLRGSLALVDVFLNKKVEIWVYKENEQYWAKDYSMNLGLGRSGTGDAYSVGAWKHGIYIMIPRANISSTLSIVVYYDLRCGDMRGTVPHLHKYWEHRERWTNMFSYTGSLISLKKYENLKDKNFFYAGESEFPEYFSELKVPRLKDKTVALWPKFMYWGQAHGEEYPQFLFSVPVIKIR